jgi:Transposase IS66 family
VNQTCKKRLVRLKTIVSLHQEKKALLASIKSMYQWVVEVEPIFDGSWASHPEEIRNAEVQRRFDAYLERLSCFLEAEERTEEEKFRLGHLLKVLTHLRPGLVQCYDIEGFPRTNNDLERTIRAIKMHYRRISGRKNWNNYLLRYGRCVAYQEWWLHQPDGEAQLQARLRAVKSSAWRHVRQQTRHCHLEQLNRFRFRHRPLDYLASLETRWEQSFGT